MDRARAHGSSVVDFSASTEKVVEQGGIKVIGKVLSSSGYQRRNMSTLKFEWETTLNLEPGKRFISSGEYIIDSETEEESHWRIELDPNYIDENGTRYLSAYLVMVEARRDDAVINGFMEVELPDASPIDAGVWTFYRKTGIITDFTKGQPQGFPEFIEFYKLGPFAKLNTTEKLKIAVYLSIMEDIPEPLVETPVEPMSVEPASPPPIKQEADFSKSEKARDTSKEFDSKALVIKIIDFCHSGKVTFPKRWNGLVNVLKAAIKLKLVELKKKCQAEVLRLLSIQTFTDVVELAKENVLEEDAKPVIYEFLATNLRELLQNDSYRSTYDDHREFYAELMYSCEFGDGDVGESEEPDHLMDIYFS